jgi:hypothetical protein
MKNLFAVLAVVTLTLLVIPSCKKKNDLPQEPIVNVLSPENNSFYHSGDTVSLRAAVSDNEDLHEMRIEVKQGNLLVFGYYPYVHAKESITADTIFKCPVVADTTDYLIEFEAEDHDYNRTLKTVNIKVAP